MQVTIELPSDIENQIREELHREVKEELSYEYLHEYIKKTDNYNLMKLIANASIYERYQKIESLPISELSKSEKFILGLYQLILSHS